MPPSCSCPCLMVCFGGAWRLGVVGLLNDQLLAAGKPSLGFMNPFLYAAAAKQASDNFQMFNVVHGGNNMYVRT